MSIVNQSWSLEYARKEMDHLRAASIVYAQGEHIERNRKLQGGHHGNGELDYELRGIDDWKGRGRRLEQKGKEEKIGGTTPPFFYSHCFQLAQI
jgi:hypothetical protein